MHHRLVNRATYATEDIWECIHGKPHLTIPGEAIQHRDEKAGSAHDDVVPEGKLYQQGDVHHRGKRRVAEEFRQELP